MLLIIGFCLVHGRFSMLESRQKVLKFCKRSWAERTELNMEYFMNKL